MIQRPIAITCSVLLILLLSSCSHPAGTLTPRPPGGVTLEPSVTPTDTPEVTPTYEGCYYVWASQDLPKLSKKLFDELQTMDKSVKGSAYAYGENCVFADGHSTFGAMETDFRVEVSVKDLKDERALGDWMYKVMQVIEQLPSGEVPGGQPGRVDFDFSGSNTDHFYLTVSIEKYRREARDLRGAELFRLFHNAP